jgi:hypothetical protein
MQVCDTSFQLRGAHREIHEKECIHGTDFGMHYSADGTNMGQTEGGSIKDRQHCIALIADR